jgi:hypothetical protein
VTQADYLRQSFAAIRVNADFTEALLTTQDGSRLFFRHRVDERSAHVKGNQAPGAENQAERVLASLARFRLNAKHLDLSFQDGSRWEVAFAGSGPDAWADSR